MITALILLWIFGGIYCIIIDWIETFDLIYKDLPIIIFCGIIIGPIMGLLHCLSWLFILIFGKTKNKILIRRGY
jgi:hypothetical protein